MSGPPRVRPMNCTEAETRSVLGPAGNKTTMVTKQGLKPQKAEKVLDQVKGKKAPSSPAELSPKQQLYVPSILKSNFSLNASCSSDASTDSTQSRASTGRIRRRSLAVATTRIRRTQSSPKSEKSDKASGGTESDTGSVTSADGLPARKRCAWVTPNTDPCYVVFHDEEWGVPVHNDKKLFELLSFSTALAELTWPAILTKRHLFREVFLDFDPIAVSKLNEKKILTPGSTASSLLSEVKLRAVIENARQVCKLIIEFGSFDKYIWGFVNHKPTVNNFRYPRQVPIKTSKADVISKDLVKRGFRGVGPTVVYSFMQVSGITNDHLVSCFRFHDCVVDVCDKNITLKAKVEDKQLLHEDSVELGLSRAIGEFNLLSEE